jgi:hypothetical protein
MSTYCASTMPSKCCIRSFSAISPLTSDSIVSCSLFMGLSALVGCVVAHPAYRAARPA